MRIDWASLKKFIDDTKLYHFINYVDLNDNVYIWVSYQGENFFCTLAKASVDYEEFEEDYKPLAIVKNDIADDGFKFIKSTHVLSGRFLNANFVVFTTSKTDNNDQSHYITMKLLDSQGEVTTESDQAVKTLIDFEPPFDYEIYGGGIETIDEMTTDFYVSAIIAPTIPPSSGGCIYNIRNKFLLRPRENVFKSGIGPSDLTYTEGMHTNLIRIEFSHNQGIENKFQLELQYYV